MALPPLLGHAFPASGLEAAALPVFETLQAVLDRDVAPLAAAHDAAGRYPTAAVAALKRSGFLRAVLPREHGGLGLTRRASLEAQVRIAAAALAQIYKVHDELLREIPTDAPPGLTARLARGVTSHDVVVGLAVAEAGRRVAAKAAAGKAVLRATSEIFTLMSTRAAARATGFDRHWRNARTLSLHDPVDWKSAEIGRHVLSGWTPPPGLYQ